MAIKAAVAISGTILGDGISRIYTLDLLNDVYNGAIYAVNWFSINHKATFPTDIKPLDGNSYSLSGTVVTVTFTNIPSATAYDGYSFYLLF